MKEVFTMWRYTKMVVLTSLTAAVYAAILIPLKGFPLIPGITEFRPANAIPIVFGLLFGPAAAWGTAIGNLIGDFFGTLGIGSIPGFIGNFFYGMIGYKTWGHWMALSSNSEPRLKSGKQFIEFVLIVLLSSSVCAMFIAWGLELLGLFPFAVLGAIITLNNSIVSLVLGPFLLWILYPRVVKFDLLWTDIMDREDISPHPSPRLGVLLIAVGGFGGLITGLLLSTGLYDASLFSFGIGSTGGGVILGVLPFIILFLIGCLLT